MEQDIMFDIFFTGIQQDLKAAVLAPLLATIFRYIFIKVYGPRYVWKQDGKKLRACFNYGFWWGLDWHAYVYLALLLIVSIPSAFITSYAQISDTLRMVGVSIYAFIMYVAFVGRMIFYYHFRDIYNPTIRLGGNADKKNLLDIFFNQNHGGSILLGIIPFIGICLAFLYGILQTPTIPLPKVGNDIGQYALNTFVFIVSVVIYYFFRFGGTLKHRNKPGWDELPHLVKDDIFLGKAVWDDFVILEKIYRTPIQSVLCHSDEESLEILKALPEIKKLSDTVDISNDIDKRNLPLVPFKRVTKGPRISKPKHIFFIVGESYTQVPFDPMYDSLHIVDRGKAFRSQEHTVCIDNFLPAGLISQPAITSLISGIFDSNLEINEMQAFWEEALPTGMAPQMKALGYKTKLWYGGPLNWASLGLFAKGAGFEQVYGGNDICGDKAPHTWLGVYDHIFLAEVKRRVLEEDQPSFNVIYTTSNHGPYTIPIKDYGWNPKEVLKDAPQWVRDDKELVASLGTYWYCDQAQFDFVEAIQKAYPDALIVVTGDHSKLIIPFGEGLVSERRETGRELFCTSFAMYHPELTQDMFSHNKIAGHMNIMPTIMEAIAPAGTEYISLMPSMFEPIDKVITPYHWLTKETFGHYGQAFEEPLVVTPHKVERTLECKKYDQERAAYCEITGWLVRHRN